MPVTGRTVERHLPLATRYAGGAGIGGAEHESVIPARNRFARVLLSFTGLTAGSWCELALRLAWHPAEAAQNVPDFALVGIDFQAADGSSLDFDHVPGLDRTLLDPHGAWIAGPAYLAGDGAPTGIAPMRMAFLVPEPARDLVVTVRSWRNTDAFSLLDPVLSQLSQTEVVGAPIATGASASTADRVRRRLGPAPLWHRHALVPGANLILRGQVWSSQAGERAAFAYVVYRDARGAVLEPPYPGTLSIPSFGALMDLPGHRQARRFALEFEAPPGAARLDVGFATWDAGGPEAELIAAPHVSLDDRLRLESLCGDDLLTAPDFLARVAERLHLPRMAVADWCPIQAEAAAIPLVLSAAQAIQHGEVDDPAGIDRTLRLGGAPAWTLPEMPDWSEDPFRSVPWRLDYHSLAWLVPMAEAPVGSSAALGLALSWSRANPWGAAVDSLALHPAALLMRTETFLRLLALAGKPGGGPSLILTGEVVRHGFAIAEIVGQHTFGRSLHQIRAAAMLMSVARAVRRLPLAAHWLSLARGALGEAVAALLGPDGAFFDPSPMQRLELLTLLRGVIPALEGTEAPASAVPEDGLAALVVERLAGAIPAVIGLLDPSGRLPSFGDTLQGVDAAAWIARLAPPAGRALAIGRPGAGSGSGAHAIAEAKTIAIHHDAPGRSWGNFACTFAGFGQGHRDCTSFVFASESVRWIVEAGGSAQVEAGAVRHHLLSARAHNIALPDRREPVAGPGWLEETTRLDGGTAYAIGTAIHGPDYAHSRIFVVLDDLSGLAVLDRFEVGSGSVTFTASLHLAPGILAALAGPRRVMAQSGRSRLAIAQVALLGRPAGIAIVNGCNDRPGAMRGFVSQGPGILQPTSVVTYTVAGAGRVCGGVTMAIDTVAEQRLAVLLAGPVRAAARVEA